jgi:hypothetical protein
MSDDTGIRAAQEAEIEALRRRNAERDCRAKGLGARPA